MFVYRSGLHVVPLQSLIPCQVSLIKLYPCRRRGIKLPADTEEGMTRIIILQEPSTLTKFLDKFDAYMHVIA